MTQDYVYFFKDLNEQYQTFDELVADNPEIKGGFWSNSTFREETKLEFLE
jgi:hypothetical protein